MRLVHHMGLAVPIDKLVGEQRKFLKLAGNSPRVSRGTITYMKLVGEKKRS